MKYTPSRYKILSIENAADEKAKVGEIVQLCMKHTYGLEREDSEARGFEHIAVTRDPDGGYPFFTIPRRDVERLTE